MIVKHIKSTSGRSMEKDLNKEILNIEKRGYYIDDIKYQIDKNFIHHAIIMYDKAPSVNVNVEFDTDRNFV